MGDVGDRLRQAQERLQTNATREGSTMPDDEGKRPQIKPFAQWLQEQSGGELHTELSEQLAELASSVMEHRKVGTLTLTVSVKPPDKAVADVVIVTDQVKVKAPEADRPSSLFFVDSHGNLSRRNPRQPELPLREVSGDDYPTGRDLKEAPAR